MMDVGRLPQTAVGPDREQLGFLGAARDRFAFLADRGFEEVAGNATYLRLERDGVFVEVFHGRASYELGVEFGRWVLVDDARVKQKFHLAEVLPVVAPEVTFVARTATSRAQVARFVEELAQVARVVVERLEDEGVEVFDRVSAAVERRSDEYLENTRAEHLRGRADAAWHRRDFVAVVIAYEEIEAELDTVSLRGSETKRLAYAREHLGR